jgi:two-component system, OmpR family, sensor histidine kinase CpxA
MNIFVRSLLSFWLATALTAGFATVFVISVANRDDHTHQPKLQQLETCGEALIDSLANGDSPRVPSLETNLRCSIHFLYAPDGRRIWGETPAPNIAHLVRMQSQRPSVPLVDTAPNMTAIVFTVPTKNGNYQAVSVMPRSAGPFPSFLWLHLAGALLISAVVFWFLARQFARPIRSLQLVAEAVANGNLNARSSWQLLNRKDELGELSRSINTMMARISELMASQKDFLAQVSHELGSPLTRLNLALALAKRKAGTELATEFRRLEAEATDLNSMIQQLLLLARLENATESDQPPVRFSLAQLIDEVADNAQFEAKQNGKNVRLTYGEATSWLSAQILGHRDLLKRAFDNVLRNAIRFTPNGGTIEVGCVVRPDNVAHVMICDQGPGVPEDKLDAIFEPFVRLANQADGNGAGLGLAIAKKAILHNGGNIGAYSGGPGEGLVVVVDLQLAPSLTQDLAFTTAPLPAATKVG